MKGKELAKLLNCIIDEQKVKWGRETLHDSMRGQYCALGLLAKSAGVPDRLLDGEGWPEWVEEKGVMADIPGLNDDADSYLEFQMALRKSKKNFPVRKFLKALKGWKKWEKENKEELGA